MKNFLSVAGGKLTTYRPLGLDALAAVLGKLGRPAPARPAAAEEPPPPWPLGALIGRGRAAEVAASAGLLSYFALRRACAGPCRRNWAAFAAEG